MSALHNHDFSDYFEALWGYSPFPWQRALAEQVAEEGWPHTLDLPTGSGKTATLDIAVFALALSSAGGVHPRRIVLVVDRRVIVDQGYLRARKIAERIENATDGVLAKVRTALASKHAELGSPRALNTAILRGGMVRDNDWARSPDQPAIIVSTVDQVGSRLLFRGYGVSSRMAPVHAGLLGSDALFLLDEVHLSRPFEETLDAVTKLADSSLIETPVAPPARVVRMSATVANSVGTPFRLGDEDRSHPVLRRRLSAPKPIALATPIKVPADEKKARPKIAKAAVDEARALLEGEASTVAIIVNRVDTARAAATFASEQKWAAKLGLDVQLVTGRMRPLDRHDATQSLLARVDPGRDRSVNAPKTLVVSTQALEAGADFDFDAIVSECASLDALRQRFGRLDRAGTLAGRARGTIVVGSRSISDDPNKDPDDPIYGTALACTWRWLNARADDGVVDFGLDSQAQWQVPADVVAPAIAAPVLLPAYLDLWAQTDPAPAVTPDISVFLHGPERDNPEVQLVWRADVTAGDLGAFGANRESLVARLNACPPSGLEALALPIWAARAWLEALASAEPDQRAATPAVSDIGGERVTAEVDDAGQIEPVVIWAGDDTTVTTRADAILPGATLVLPSTYGGIARGNWDPEASEAIADLGDRAQIEHRGIATVRWDVVDRELPELGRPIVETDALEESGPTAHRDAFEQWSREVLARDDVPDWLRASLDALASHAPKTLEIERTVRDEDEPSRTKRVTWTATVARRRIPASEQRRLIFGEAQPSSWTDDDSSSFTGRRVPLVEHLGGVRDFASRFAEHLGLPSEIADDLALSGWVHDVGKADPRFQLLLHGGDEVAAALSDALIAKSASVPTDRQAYQRALKRSGYPRGMRHELLSVAMIETVDAFRSRAHDLELVLHLVASHHGRCRPLAPVQIDDSPEHVRWSHDGMELTARTDHELASLDSGVAHRFWTLTKRYGWHGLAFLESVLRLADHRSSEAEQLKEARDD